MTVLGFLIRSTFIHICILALTTAILVSSVKAEVETEVFGTPEVENTRLCVICFDDLVSTKSSNLARCSKEYKHVFHSACMLEWLSKNNYCPLCKADCTKVYEEITKSMLKECMSTFIEMEELPPMAEEVLNNMIATVSLKEMIVQVVKNYAGLLRLYKVFSKTFYALDEETSTAFCEVGERFLLRMPTKEACLHLLTSPKFIFSQNVFMLINSQVFYSHLSREQIIQFIKHLFMLAKEDSDFEKKLETLFALQYIYQNLDGMGVDGVNDLLDAAENLKLTELQNRICMTAMIFGLKMAPRHRIGMIKNALEKHDSSFLTKLDLLRPLGYFTDFTADMRQDIIEHWRARTRIEEDRLLLDILCYETGKIEDDIEAKIFDLLDRISEEEAQADEYQHDGEYGNAHVFDEEGSDISRFNGGNSGANSPYEQDRDLNQNDETDVNQQGPADLYVDPFYEQNPDPYQIYELISNSSQSDESHLHMNSSYGSNLSFDPTDESIFNTSQSSESQLNDSTAPGQSNLEKYQLKCFYYILICPPTRSFIRKLYKRFDQEKLSERMAGLHAAIPLVNLRFRLNIASICDNLKRLTELDKGLMYLLHSSSEIPFQGITRSLFDLLILTEDSEAKTGILLDIFFLKYFFKKNLQDRINVELLFRKMKRAGMHDTILVFGRYFRGLASYEDYVAENTSNIFGVLWKQSCVFQSARNIHYSLYITDSEKINMALYKDFAEYMVIFLSRNKHHMFMGHYLRLLFSKEHFCTCITAEQMVKIILTFVKLGSVMDKFEDYMHILFTSVRYREMKVKILFAMQKMVSLPLLDDGIRNNISRVLGILFKEALEVN